MKSFYHIKLNLMYLLALIIKHLQWGVISVHAERIFKITYPTKNYITTT